MVKYGNKDFYDLFVGRGNIDINEIKENEIITVEDTKIKFLSIETRIDNVVIFKGIEIKNKRNIKKLYYYDIRYEVTFELKPC